MKNITYVLLLILCAGLFVGATEIAGQTGADRALTAGKNPLRQTEVEKLIEFYEWAFESRFTADERTRFQTLTINEFRNNPAASRATVDDIVQTLPRILAVGDDVQAATRKNFLQVFLPEARKNSDENSQMLLAIYERAHDEGRSSSGNGTDRAENNARGNSGSAPASGRGGNADELSGKWHRGVGDGFVDGTGKTRYKSGEDFYFEFFSDGTVAYNSKLDVLTITQCTIKGENKARGTYTVASNSLTINLGAMSSVQTHSCDKKENYSKTLEASNTTVKFEVRKMDSLFRTDNPTILCFDGAKDEACYERIKQ